MKVRYLLFLICIFILIGCGTHNLRVYKQILPNEHSITVPPGGHALTGALKDLLKLDKWTLYVDTQTASYEGNKEPSISITSKRTLKTRYELIVTYSQYDICVPSVQYNPAINYDISIIDNIDGDEVMNLSGRGCQSHVIEEFEKWLNQK